MPVYGDVITSIFFRNALLPDGWAHDVRITISDGRLESVVSGDTSMPGDMRFDIGIPGLPNLHSHAFQRGMAALSERRGSATDDFWTWREVMYRFLNRMTPEDVEAVAARAYLVDRLFQIGLRAAGSARQEEVDAARA